MVETFEGLSKLGKDLGLDPKAELGIMAGIMIGGGKLHTKVQNYIKDASKEMKGDSLNSIIKDIEAESAAGKNLGNIESEVKDLAKDASNGKILDEMNTASKSSTMETVAKDADDIKNIKDEATGIAKDGVSAESKLDTISKDTKELDNVKNEVKEIFKELDSKVNEKVIDYDYKIHKKKFKEVTRGTIGPAVAGAYNSKTGETFIDINEQNGFLPEVIHPLIDSRVNNMPKKVYDSYIKYTKAPGSHAECNALNSALINEFKITNNIKEDVTQEMLDAQYDSLKDVDISHIYISVQNLETYKSLPEIGMPMPRCVHCQYITNGVTVNLQMLENEMKSELKLEDLLNGD